jgi:DNA-binding MarR family transcriptional regulator
VLDGSARHYRRQGRAGEWGGGGAAGMQSSHAHAIGARTEIGVYTPISAKMNSRGCPMSAPEICNCLALRQATRRITQFYDGFMAPSGVRGTQFSVLAKLRSLGPLTVNELAAAMVMDRTTLGRNLGPLRRKGLVEVAVGEDRRRREIRLTLSGAAALEAALPLWREAQAAFEALYGGERAAALRGALHEVATIDAPAEPS